MERLCRNKVADSHRLEPVIVAEIDVRAAGLQVPTIVSHDPPSDPL